MRRDLEMNRQPFGAWDNIQQLSHIRQDKKAKFVFKNVFWQQHIEGIWEAPGGRETNLEMISVLLPVSDYCSDSFTVICSVGDMWKL